MRRVEDELNLTKRGLRPGGGVDLGVAPAVLEDARFGRRRHGHASARRRAARVVVVVVASTANMRRAGRIASINVYAGTVAVKGGQIAQSQGPDMPLK